MTELDRATNDLRRDLIDEIANAKEHDSAQSMVDAIRARLANGLPKLVEVEIEAEPNAQTQNT